MALRLQPEGVALVDEPWYLLLAQMILFLLKAWDICNDWSDDSIILPEAAYKVVSKGTETFNSITPVSAQAVQISTTNWELVTFPYLFNCSNTLVEVFCWSPCPEQNNFLSSGLEFFVRGFVDQTLLREHPRIAFCALLDHSKEALVGLDNTSIVFPMTTLNCGSLGRHVLLFFDRYKRLTMNIQI